VTISFLCSILESVLLSIQMSYVSLLEKELPITGKILRSHKENINVSIASILILNTVANTLGAAAVGAEASKLFGNEAVMYVSIILTFAILYISEIIPKTIGAIYWKQLAPVSAHIIKFFIFITYPIILTTLFITNKISHGHEEKTTKDELLESMLMSEDEGIIDEKEFDYIENVLKLDEVKVSDILTPRSVVFALEEHLTVKEVLETQDDIFNFSRIPIYNNTIDNVTGIILTKQLFRESLNNVSATLSSIKKDIFSINENIPVAKALDLFITRKEHMFLVTDSYDQTEGIVTLEDCVETVLGIEIVDESDKIDDMRELAKRLMKQKRRAKYKR
jgi:CBS domain containing-hemolysin-like protein